MPKRLNGVEFRYLEDNSDTLVLAVTVDVTVDGDAVDVPRMVIEAGTQKITRKLVGQLDPMWFAKQALSPLGFAPEGNGRGFTPDPAGTAAALGTLPRRRSVTRARLTEVAAAYQRGGAKAVERDCNVSRSQAFRLVKQARKAGVLGEDER